MNKPSEYYLEARGDLLEAIRGTGRLPASLETPDGTRIKLARSLLFRVFHTTVDRLQPGEDDWTAFVFSAGGWVHLGGARGWTLRQVMAAGHPPQASRRELLELAAQIRSARPAGAR